MVARGVFVEDGEWTLVSVEDMIVNLDVVAHEAEAGWVDECAGYLG